MKQPEPELGHVQIPEDRPEWIALLKRLYEFEAGRVAGPGSMRRDIRDVLWSMEDLFRGAAISITDQKACTEIIQFLADRRQLMVVPAHDDQPPRHITRVAETIRLLGHTYEYWYRGRAGIGAVRWLIELKRVPRRGITPKQFEDAIIGELKEKLGAPLQATNLETAVRRVIEGCAKFLQPKNPDAARFSQFQLDATIGLLLADYHSPHKPKSYILTAGVGTGKTLGFAIAALISAVESLLSGGPQRRTQIFLYPRTALAKDQAGTMTAIASKINLEKLLVFFDHHSNLKDMGLGTVKSALPKIYGPGRNHIDIIVTTFETLKQRLRVPVFAVFVAERLRRVVLDEIHLAEGISGAHIAMLMSRVAALARGPISWSAASATVARPDDHAGRIFGKQARDVGIIQPNEDDMMSAGIVHHIFLRPSGMISPQGSLVNATSLLLHLRRDDIGKRPSDDRRREKTIAFADNLELLGRWNADLRENERTENARERPHANTDQAANWDQHQKEMPYALRFQKPLEKRIETEAGTAPEDYEPVLTEFRGKHICGRCHGGERVSLGTVDAATLSALSKIPYKWPASTKNTVKAMRIRHRVFAQKEAEIGTLDLCPYLIAGACTWFPRQDYEAVEPIPNTAPPAFEWKSVARSTVHSAKTDSSGENIEGDLAELVFSDAVDAIYGLRAVPTKRVPLDIVLASPSLEVGVDLPGVTESVMSRAIRNIASYRQKAGRVGRELHRDVLNVTVVSDLAIDLHYYRQPRKLISRGRLDPIPMKDRNQAVLMCALYNGIWDWLAARADVPELVPTQIYPTGQTEFAERLNDLSQTLQARKTEVADHLSRVTKAHLLPGAPEISEAIAQVQSEIDLLRRPITGTLHAQPVAPNLLLADAFAYMLAGPQGRIVRPVQVAALESFDYAVRDFKQERPRVTPEAISAEQAFRDLDRMAKTEDWDPAKLKRIIVDLRSRLAHKPDPFIEDFVAQRVQALESRLTVLSGSGVDLWVLAAYRQYRDLLVKQPWRGHYLSSLMMDLPAFEAVRREAWFVRPQNLFSSPYEEQVRVLKDGTNDVLNVPITEALFGFIPGTWTFRLGEGAYKVLAGKLRPEPGGRLISTLDQLHGVHDVLDRIRSDLPPPPGIQGRLTVYRPKEISIRRWRDKYLPVDRISGLALDRDEADARPATSAGGGRIPQLKIPKGFLQRWINVLAPQAETIGCFEPPSGVVVLETSHGTLTGPAALTKIRHPVFGALLEDVAWHADMKVVEYTYSVSRAYTLASGEGATVFFENEYGPIGFGTSYDTEGLSIRLETKRFDEALHRILGRLQKAHGPSTPSIIKLLKAYISELQIAQGGSPSPFILDDLAGVVAQAFGLGQPFTFQQAVQRILELSQDDQALIARLREHYSTQTSLTEEDSPEGAVPHDDDRFIQDRTRSLLEAFRLVAGAIQQRADSSQKLDEFTQLWIRRAVLTTFGVVALNTLQEYSGANDKDVGYSVDETAWQGGPPKIYLFDRSPFGNGSSAVVRKYLHIPHFLRGNLLLPSDDYLSMLEENLLQCPQFHTDFNALAMKSDPTHAARGLPGLDDIQAQSEEVLHVANHTWDALGVRGPADGWILPIAGVMKNALARSRNLEKDDLLRATNVCWNGCPECVDRADLVLGGLLGRNYLDKAILDDWFSAGIRGTKEYAVMDLFTLAASASKLPLGAPQKLTIDFEGYRLRSAQLPWTIGVEIDRNAAEVRPHLILRLSDVLDVALVSPHAEGLTTGIGAGGFKRLLWFDLLLTAYLDILGLLPVTAKRITLVYYDCRDVHFDDVGISSRMLDAIQAEAGAGAGSELDSLSDIIAWLARRGFNIRICVDEQQSGQEGVDAFLRRASAMAGPNLRILTKQMPGVMHKKVLVTPVALLKGSANLTESGAHRNEELNDHIPAGHPSFPSAATNVEDTFVGAKPWKP